MLPPVQQTASLAASLLRCQRTILRSGGRTVANGWPKLQENFGRQLGFQSTGRASGTRAIKDREAEIGTLRTAFDFDADLFLGYN
jgi:hypothetical protein